MSKLWHSKINEMERNSVLNDDISTNENIYLNHKGLDKVDVNGLYVANAINDQNSIQIKNSRTNV